METAFVIIIGLISTGCIWAIIKMVRNKLKGKDELDGILDFKKASGKLQNKDKSE